VRRALALFCADAAADRWTTISTTDVTDRAPSAALRRLHAHRTVRIRWIGVVVGRTRA
jgi:hypothetical protein